MCFAFGITIIKIKSKIIMPQFIILLGNVMKFIGVTL